MLLPLLHLGQDIGVELGRGISDRVRAVTGIDVSTEMIERARRNLEGTGAQLHVGDGVSLQPLPDAGFDAVVSLVVGAVKRSVNLCL